MGRARPGLSMVTSPGSAEEKILALAARLADRPESLLFLPLAEALRKAGRLREAERALGRGLSGHPGHHSARVALGRVLIELRRPAEARPELERVLRAIPDNLLAARLLAEVDSHRDQDPPDAEPADPAFLAPESVDPLNSLTLAELYLKQGDRDAALAVYNDVAARQSANPRLREWYDSMLASTPAPEPLKVPERHSSRPAQDPVQVPSDWKPPAEPRVLALRRFLDAAKRLRAADA